MKARAAMIPANISTGKSISGISKPEKPIGCAKKASSFARVKLGFIQPVRY